MIENEVRREYFNWLCDIVCGYRYSQENSYDNLLAHLHNIEFTWTISKDSNRAEDGIGLRRRFDEMGDVIDLLDGPCSVFEMMVALAIRVEENIMDDPRYGDRTGQWFWKMINNLGLGSMSDRCFDTDYVDNAIKALLNHEYEPNGRWGLFMVRNCDCDMRKLEIWHQLCLYLDSISI